MRPHAPSRGLSDPLCSRTMLAQPLQTSCPGFFLFQPMWPSCTRVSDRMAGQYKRMKLELKKRGLAAIWLHTPPLPNPIGKRFFWALFEGRRREISRGSSSAPRSGSDELSSPSHNRRMGSFGMNLYWFYINLVTFLSMSNQPPKAVRLQWILR